MATTPDLLARTRDLIAEHDADLYSDATEILPALNDGKDIVFSDIDVLLKTVALPLVAGVSTYAIADLGRVVWMKYRTGTAGAYTYRDLRFVRNEDVAALLELTGSEPLYVTTDLLDSSGDTQITVFPTPATGITGDIYVMYHSVPADLALDSAIAATLAIDSAASDSDINVTALHAGTVGNSIRVALVANAGTNPLSVSTSGFDITVELETDAGSPVSTAAEVVAAIEAYLPAAALIEAEVVGSGTGVVDAMSITALSGGSGTGGGVNPSWHRRFHFLPCYHAASVLLRKDRRPEAAVEMEQMFRMGMVEYQRWYNGRRPYMADAVLSKPSPNESFEVADSYPYEIG